MKLLQTAEAQVRTAIEPARASPGPSNDLSSLEVAGAMHDLGNLIQVASSAIALIARHPDMPGLVSVTANEFYARYFFARWRDELQAVEDLA